MSYDVVAFEQDALEPETAVGAGGRDTEADFDAWFDGAAWSDDADTEDPATTSPRLRAYCEILWTRFPAMNDGLSPTGEGAQQVSRALSDVLADYTYGPHLVQTSFSDAVARDALAACAAAASQAGVSLALVSAGRPTPVLPPT
ncbi:hypothetical protein CLV28_1779 [Sediminihabitans luteus]|uniref:Uncharacterized protein n=1 Tax=Sediminihabitans luteus TaxID=1138585 RepID=A0A2M9CR25_9CELL|nr:hypothetical protein [Sediminihabitans luteus]PJJ74285.1 hypothetical protein CLV28_1779 [Sediminihabitans luteus]GII99138.1 hypothetical protein Slu03_15160 [Sediminihabitans luteus]